VLVLVLVLMLVLLAVLLAAAALLVVAAAPVLWVLMARAPGLEVPGGNSLGRRTRRVSLSLHRLTALAQARPRSFTLARLLQSEKPSDDGQRMTPNMVS